MSIDRHANAIGRFAALDDKLQAGWKRLFAQSPLIKTIQAGRVDRRLYAIYLVETYHYTLHNARNQALVGVRALDVSVPYLKFCFEHAAEETGHEHMALHDLRALGVPREAIEIPPPLPMTEALIAYLYWISATGNPLRRLGYSYWAESSYEFVMPLVTRVQQTLGLTPSQTTFFVAHSRIDEEHAAQVRRMLAEQCRTDEDWREVERAMVTSLRLMGEMLNNVYAEYEELMHDRAPGYAFLGAMQ